MPPTSIDLPTCGECGVPVADVTTHTRWHAGSDRQDTAQVIVEFLDSVDPAQLSQAALEHEGDGDPIAAALAILKDLAASQ